MLIICFLTITKHDTSKEKYELTSQGSRFVLNIIVVSCETHEHYLLPLIIRISLLKACQNFTQSYKYVHVGINGIRKPAGKKIKQY